MPFTQREIDEVYELTCRFHSVDPDFFGWPPLLGSDIPRNATADQITEAIKHRLRNRSNR